WCREAPSLVLRRPMPLDDYVGDLAHGLERINGAALRDFQVGRIESTIGEPRRPTRASHRILFTYIASCLRQSAAHSCEARWFPPPSPISPSTVIASIADSTGKEVTEPSAPTGRKPASRRRTPSASPRRCPPVRRWGAAIVGAIHLVRE